MKNVFYFHKINDIGGVESFFYYLSCVFNNMVVYYKVGDPKQIERLSKNIEVHKYKEPIKCDRFFCNYGYDIEVDAKDYIHMVHYDAMNVGFTPMTNDNFRYIGVSKVACDSFYQKTGNKCELIYNVVPIQKKGIEKKKDKIYLISATRLSSEKGGDRINKLANMLDKARVNYEWHIYTNRVRFKHDSKNIIVHEQKLDLTKEVEESTYLVQLSSCESFGLSVCESLILGTPVIITDLEAFKEIGCVHGKNAIICDLGMNNVDIDMIVKGLPKFEYKPPKSEWNKYLDNNGKYNPNELIDVMVKRKYFDLDLGINVERNKIYKMKRSRASYLEAKDFVEVL